MAAAAGLVTAFVDRLREQGALFAEKLIAAQEAERRRVSRELHDEIGQALTAVRLNVDALEKTREPAAFEARFQDTMAIIDRALQQVRDLSLELRPPMLDDLGLVAAIRSHVKREAERAGIAAEVIADPLERRLPSELETACFRIVQEALTNVIRHSGAKHVRVGLAWRGDELSVTVADDGKGFDVTETERRRPGLGLQGIRERAAIVGGSVEIESAPGRGTKVRATFPIPD
jgi:signal transduction histidine kinase